VITGGVHVLRRSPSGRVGGRDLDPIVESASEGPVPEPPYRLERLRIPWTEIPVPGMRIHHEATWRRDESQKHVCWFGNDATLEFRGKQIEGSGAHADVRLEGPGSIIRFDFSLSRGRGRVVLFQSHTPIAPLTQHVRFRWFSDAMVPFTSFVAGTRSSTQPQLRLPNSDRKERHVDTK
jgi:hypothetical protein